MPDPSVLQHENLPGPPEDTLEEGVPDWAQELLNKLK
jgi:hypothetical protein